jgi:hypothetical protein
MIPDYFPVRSTNLLLCSNVLVAIHDVPRQTNEIMRTGVRCKKHLDEIVQRLPNLAGKILGLKHSSRGIPSDLTRNGHDFPGRDSTIRISARLSPTFGLYDSCTLSKLFLQSKNLRRFRLITRCNAHCLSLSR